MYICISEKSTANTFFISHNGGTRQRLLTVWEWGYQLGGIRGGGDGQPRAPGHLLSDGHPQTIQWRLCLERASSVGPLHNYPELLIFSWFLLLYDHQIWALWFNLNNGILICFLIKFQIISVYTCLYTHTQLSCEQSNQMKIANMKKYVAVSFFCLSCKIEMSSVIQHSSLLWILHLKINCKTIRNLSSAMQSNPSYVSLVIDLWSHSSTAFGNTCWFLKGLVHRKMPI